MYDTPFGQIPKEYKKEWSRPNPQKMERFQEDWVFPETLTDSEGNQWLRKDSNQSETISYFHNGTNFHSYHITFPRDYPRDNLRQITFHETSPRSPKTNTTIEITLDGKVTTRVNNDPKLLLESLAAYQKDRIEKILKKSVSQSNFDLTSSYSSSPQPTIEPKLKRRNLKDLAEQLHSTGEELATLETSSSKPRKHENYSYTLEFTLKKDDLQKFKDDLQDKKVDFNSDKHFMTYSPNGDDVTIKVSTNDKAPILQQKAKTYIGNDNPVRVIKR
jgi:hypothetical protein